MDVIIYGDVLFLINFSMDFLSLFIVSKLLHRQTAVLQMLLSAAIGAIYGVAAVVLEGSLWLGLLINIAVSLLMCYIAFGKQLLRCTALFYTVGFVLGGSVTAVFSLINRMRGEGQISVNGGVVTLPGEIPLGWMAATALVTGAAAVLGGRFAALRKAASIVKVCVSDGGRSVTFSALTDSGNMLREPIGGAPVIVLSSERLMSLLPDDLRPVFGENGIGKVDEIDITKLRKVRFIPAEGVCGTGVMVGYMPDLVDIGGIKKTACIASAGPGKEFSGCEAIIPSVLV